MKQFIFLFLFCTSSFFAFGQEYQSYWNDANKAFRNGDYDKAIKDYRSYIVLGGSYNAEFITKAEKCKTLLGNANVLFDAGNYSEAAAKYQELLKLNPSDSNAQKHIAECNQLEPTTTKGSIPPTRQGLKSTSAKTPEVFTHFGIKGGLNLSTIINNTTDIDFSPQMNIGYHAGILLNLRFGNRTGNKVNQGVLGLQPELLFSSQGFAVNGNAISFNYITVPLMIKLYFGENFNLEFGPWGSYLMTVSPNSTTIGDKYDINLLDLQNGKDIGVAAGIEYDTDFGLIIGARYNQGLSDMAKNLLWKNSVVAISLGWKFNNIKQ